MKGKIFEEFFYFLSFFITGNEVNLDTTLNPPLNLNVLKNTTNLLKDNYILEFNILSINFKFWREKIIFYFIYN